ncbi:MAG: hypothetical protein NT149_01255 [Candidatus Gottesmanbacteria bacterium]|nr:hypothetical protein [Candidatus Gottesmanbacteria bacterium]
MSEELLGKWVGLAAEHTLLDAKKMPDEADGARWIALDGKVARLEDAIVVAHQGKKSVSLDERFIKIIADPKGDTVERLVGGLHDVTDTLVAAPGRAAVKLAPLAVAGSMLLSSCSGDYFQTPIEVPTVTPNPAFTQTVPGMETPSPTEFQPALTPSGPETTPNVPRPYPGSLTVETAAQGIAAVVDAPPEITGLADVQFIITKHAQLAQAVGLSFDHMAVKYAAAEQRWFLVPVAGDGTTIAGWLEIEDSSSQSGWRYGEQPTWDSLYHPSTDTYQYGLPALHDPANHFVIGFVNGFPVLIEVTSTSAPQYWNNIVEKSMMLVEGAVLPTNTPVPSETPIPPPTETPQIPFENGPSREFSTLYPAEWHNKWTGNVTLADGSTLNIPIIVGLAYDVVHDTTFPVTPFIGVTITQGGADAVADAFLRASHYRYTKLMGNDVTYEQYLDLLKQPTGGEVLMMITDDTGVRREAWINPRQGFSMLIGDDIDPKLGGIFNRGGFKTFFGVDGQGRLLTATDTFLSANFNPYFINKVEISDDSFIYANFGVLDLFGMVKNTCMASGNSLSACGETVASPETNAFWQQLRAREKTQLANGKNLDFDIVRP